MEAFRNTAACSHTITGEEGAASVLNISRQALMWNWSSKGCLLGPSCPLGLPVGSEVKQCLLPKETVLLSVSWAIPMCAELLGCTGKLLLPSVIGERGSRA